MLRDFDAVGSALDRGDAARAIALLRDLVRREPKSALFHEQLGFALVNGGAASLDEAEHELKLALALDPRRARVWSALGRCALARRDVASASAKQAREQRDLAAARASAQQEREQTAAAEQALRECLRLEPTYPEGLIELGKLLIDEGERALRLEQPARARELYAEVETIAGRLAAAVPADSREARDAAAARALAQQRLASLAR